MTRQVGLAEIGQISVPVQDVEWATTFYRDRLGMRHLFTAPPGLSFFACGSVRLMLSRPEGPDQPQRGSVLYFRVTEIQQAHRTSWTGGSGSMELRISSRRWTPTTYGWPPSMTPKTTRWRSWRRCRTGEAGKLSRVVGCGRSLFVSEVSVDVASFGDARRSPLRPPREVISRVAGFVEP